MRRGRAFPPGRVVSGKAFYRRVRCTQPNRFTGLIQSKACAGSCRQRCTTSPVDDDLESPGAVVVADWLEAVIDSQK
jgi:hypothetical protein